MSATASIPLHPPARTQVRRCPLRRIAEFAGFTLVELLAVIAILAVLLALAIPLITRIRVAGELISEADLTALLEECEEVNGGLPITFFEITTAAAFLASFIRLPRTGR